MPNGRKKLVEKRIIRHPDISELISDGSIVIDELCGVDAEASDHRPCIYIRLLRIIFESYQLNGRLPEKEGFILQSRLCPKSRIRFNSWASHLRLFTLFTGNEVLRPGVCEWLESH